MQSDELIDKVLEEMDKNFEDVNVKELMHLHKLRENLVKKLLSDKNMRHRAVIKEYVKGYNWTYFGLEGTIKYTSRDELKKNKFFNIFYDELSSKYKKLIDVTLEILEYSATNLNRGFRGETKQFQISILADFYVCCKASFDVAKFIKGTQYFYQNNYSMEYDYDYVYMVIASEFRTNPDFLTLFKAMIYDNENVQHLSLSLIKGAIVSNYDEAIKAVLDLLKAAKLSEGLRSSVVNFIDYGSLETYKLFLNYIKEENLIRFSSVKTAFTLFTGLEMNDGKNELLAKYVTDCLLDNKTKEYLEDENATKVYIGLYALACTEQQVALNYIMDNYKDAKSYRRASMLYYLKSTTSEINSKLITECLINEENDKITAYILSEINNIGFDNNTDKKEYVIAFLNSIKGIKKTTKYGFFGYDGSTKLNIELKYNDVLEYVKELGEDELYERAYELFGKYDVYEKNYNTYYKYTFFDSIYHPIQREMLIKNLSSSLYEVRHLCFKTLGKLVSDYTEKEYLEIAKQFKSKRSDVRINLCSIFKQASPEVILNTAEYLLNQKKAEFKNGGLSILVDSLEKVQSFDKYKEIQSLIKDQEFTSEAITLKNTLLQNSLEETTEQVEPMVEELDVPTLKWDKKLVEKITNYDFSLMKQLMKKWYDMFLEHNGKEIEITRTDDSKETIVIGTDMMCVDRYRYMYAQVSNTTEQYKDFILYQEFIGELDKISREQFALLVYMQVLVSNCKDAVRLVNSSYLSSVKELENYNWCITKGLFPINLKEMVQYIIDEKTGEELLSFVNFKNIIWLLRVYYTEKLNNKYNLSDIKGYNEVLLNYLAYSIEFYKNAKQDEKPYIYDIDILNDLGYFDDNYAFNILKNLLHLFEHSPVDDHVYLHFVEKGLLKKDYLISKLLDPKFLIVKRFVVSRYVLGSMAQKLAYIKRKVNDDCQGTFAEDCLPYTELMQDILKQATTKMIDIELSRTDSKTKYTDMLSEMSLFYGVDIFAKSLDKLRNIDFVRAYSYTAALGIKDIFSRIIEHVRPEDNLTDKEFAKAIKKYGISDKKLLEACLYNSHFTKFGAKYLNIRGLEKAMYYFKAHSIDYVNAATEDTKRMINRYSNFELEDFVDGKMDIKWFNEIQKELSKEDYKKVYDASKYIMNTSKRKRGQYFADAVLGNLDVAEVEEKINDKRNQDMLLCYGLLPLGTGAKKDLETINRYKRLQQFIKEAKQFGAARKATETKRANIAISNLATNYGLDINRFTWVMEAKLIDDIKEVFEPKTVGETTVHLSLENVQKPEVIVYKDGKQLKSVPTKYKKDEHIMKINNAKKEIKNQFSRARKTLENSMTNKDEFSIDELKLMEEHPIVSKIVQNILFVASDFIGFYKDGKLVDLNEKVHSLSKKSKIRIAHCVDLFENDWVAWQNYIIENELVQPFKQVFRELYTLTEEELVNDGYTNRFAGYQIETKKAFALLNSRDWLSDEYGGFEKVNHAQNLRVELYRYVNIRNANNVEEDSIEQVKFIDNSTNKTMDMQKLDKILFSETMRDLDLVVSVAYVGGVDPLLNHTTLEMRKRILEHNLELFKIDNYEIKEKHIAINGTLANYHIHLGSGIVSVEGKGMLPMTPVHNQKRGKIFLPFIDEDPKASEIITKVLMLAQDNKLKDPTILKFLR